MILAGRNQIGLTEQEIEKYVQVWEALCGEKKRELVITQAATHSSQTRFANGRVYLGANVKPGHGIEANARMSVLACLAHELAHVERDAFPFERPFELPDNLLDEAETSLHASFHPLLSRRDREDLVEDARDRLIQWLAVKQQEVEV